MNDSNKLMFRLFTAGITLAFLWILSPYAGALLWSVVFAILFTRPKEWIAARIGGRHGLASLLTLLVIVFVVIVPVFLLVGMVLGEAAGLYRNIKSGDVNLSSIASDLLAKLPESVKSLLQSAGLGSQSEALETLSEALSGALAWIASSASGFGQSAFGLVIAFGISMYLTYFLLMDGRALIRRIEASVPLDSALYSRLILEFSSVVRAMIKGSLVVAAAQGLIGGFVFALLGISAAPLWGALMGVMSLIPAVGTGIVWVPVALYLLATGAFVDALILTLCGVLVIGMVDNILRPILVGRETKLPDYLVLISTLGGIAVAGFNGLILGPLIAALFLVVWNTHLDSSQPEPLREVGEP